MLEVADCRNDAERMSVRLIHLNWNKIADHLTLK